MHSSLIFHKSTPFRTTASIERITLKILGFCPAFTLLKVLSYVGANVLVLAQWINAQNSLALLLTTILSLFLQGMLIQMIPLKN